METKDFNIVWGVGTVWLLVYFACRGFWGWFGVICGIAILLPLICKVWQHRHDIAHDVCTLLDGESPHETYWIGSFVIILASVLLIALGLIALVIWGVSSLLSL